MKWQVYFFEYIIDFIEILISCYFATLFYEKRIFKKGRALFLFSVSGAACMFLREVGVISIPDFTVPIVVLFLYSWKICYAKAGSAVFLSVLNYFLLGVVNIFVPSFLQLFFGIDDQPGVLEYENRVFLLVIIHLAQVIVFGIILRFQKQFFRDSSGAQRVSMGILLVPFFSCFFLLFLRFVEHNRTPEMIYYNKLFISFLVLGGNLAFFFFKAVLVQERQEKAVFQEHSRLAEMQLRNQREVGEIYENMCMLRHDISSHLSTVFGYIELEEYKKAREYIERMRTEMDSMEFVHTGNVTVDALLGSKGVLARKNSIRVDVEAVVPSELQIEETHLTVMIGNLYDNAIDASLKIEDISKRYIKIEIAYKEGNLLICFSNAAKEDAKRIGGIWHTTKTQAADHGFGLKSIDRVVSQYNGFCRRELKDNFFTCQIRISDIRVEE